MKTTSRIFALLFLSFGFAGLAATIYGAYHQMFLAGASFLVAVVLLIDSMKKIEKHLTTPDEKDLYQKIIETKLKNSFFTGQKVWFHVSDNIMPGFRNTTIEERFPAGYGYTQGVIVNFFLIHQTVFAVVEVTTVNNSSWDKRNIIDYFLMDLCNLRTLEQLNKYIENQALQPTVMKWSAFADTQHLYRQIPR